jgi:hypothetical protein
VEVDTKQIWRYSGTLNSDGHQFHYINKTNNHLSPQLAEHKKEGLNSDGQQKV